MPHQCTNCGHTFDDGSKEMLSGCPDCGGTKFQFHPDEVPEEPTSDSPPRPDDGGVVGRAADTVRDIVRDDEPPAPHERDDPVGSTGDAPPAEDAAQADARTEVVDSDDLPDPEDADAVGPEDDDAPGLEELREELNDQFESIRIVDRGRYELNLMELYDREEYIIALQENGRYVIEVPDAWHGDEE